MRNLYFLVLVLGLMGCNSSEELSGEGDTSARIPTAEELAAYPLTLCIVTDEPLGSMGDAFNYYHEDTLVRMCCDHCLEGFQEDPEKYLAKLEIKAPETENLGSPAQ